MGPVAGQPAGSFVTQEEGGEWGMVSPKLSRLLSSQLLDAGDEAQSRCSGTVCPEERAPSFPRARAPSCRLMGVTGLEAVPDQQ